VSAVSFGRPVDREPRLAARAISDTNVRLLSESPRFGPKTSGWSAGDPAPRGLAGDEEIAEL